MTVDQKQAVEKYLRERGLPTPQELTAHVAKRDLEHTAIERFAAYTAQTRLF